MSIGFKVFLITMISYQATSQDLNYKLTWGDEFKEPNYDFTFLPSYDSTEYLGSSRKILAFYSWLKPVFTRFSNGKNLLISNELDLKKEIPLPLKDKLYILYPGDEGHGEILFAVELNTKTLALKNEKVKLLPFNKNRLHFIISRDRSKFAVVQEPSMAVNNLGVIYSVFDSELNLLWEKEVKASEKQRRFEIQSETLDDNGNVYFSSLECENLDFRVNNGKSNFGYEIFAIQNDGKSISKFPVNLEGVFATDLTLKVKNKVLYCAGFYSKKKKHGEKGYFIIRIDLLSQNIISSFQSDFDRTFIYSRITFEPDKSVSIDEELNNYKIQDILITEGEDVIILGEQNYETRHGRFGGLITYHSNEIIVIAIDQSGKLKWLQTINKNQTSSSSDELSYGFAFSRDKFLFLFNDHPSNYLTQQKNLKTFTSGKSVIVLAVINQNGELHRQVLKSEKKNDFIYTKSCLQISKNKILLFRNNYGRGQIGSLVIDSE